MAVLATGCSVVPDAVNPARLFQSDEEPAPGAEDEFPNLAEVPDEPRPASTPEQIRAVREGLIADRENARYTDAELRNRSVDEVNFATSAAPASEARRPISEGGAPDAAVEEAREIARKAAARAEAVRAAQEAKAAKAAEAEAAAVAAAEAAPAPTVQSEALTAPPPEPAPQPQPKPVSTDAPPKQPAKPSVQTRAVESIDRFREQFTDAFNAETPSSASATGTPPGNVQFAPGSKDIAAAQREQLKDIAATFAEAGGTVRVIGHAPASGGGGALAYDRALAVASELERQGIPVESMRVLAGPVDASDPDSPALDRVDIFIAR